MLLTVTEWLSKCVVGVFFVADGSPQDVATVAVHLLILFLIIFIIASDSFLLSDLLSGRADNFVKFKLVFFDLGIQNE